MSSFHSLLLADPHAYTIPDVAKALAVVKKLAFADATMMAKRSWGILEENLDASTSSSLVLSYKQAGLSVMAVPMETVIVPKEEILPSLDWASFSWDLLRLIGVVSYNQSSQMMTKTVTGGQTPGQFIASAGLMLATGLPIRIGEKKKVVEQKKEVHEQIFWMDLFFQSPDKRLRIIFDHFDYGCLGAQKEASALLNFRRLLPLITQKSPAAKVNKGARILLQNQPVNLMGYDSASDFERECRWLWTVLRLHPEKK